jgi:hypothetical protein
MPKSCPLRYDSYNTDLALQPYSRLSFARASLAGCAANGGLAKHQLASRVSTKFHIFDENAPLGNKITKEAVRWKGIGYLRSFDVIFYLLSWCRVRGSYGYRSRWLTNSVVSHMYMIWRVSDLGPLAG